MSSPEILLTDEQRLEFTQIPPNISEWEIAKYYTLTDRDIKIINLHRRDYNKLGFAVQLCCLRNPSWSLVNISNIPVIVLSYIAEQLSIPVQITPRGCGRATLVSESTASNPDVGYSRRLG